jgi:hypothetical protein
MNDLQDLIDVEHEATVEDWHKLGLIIIDEPALAPGQNVAVTVDALLQAIRAGLIPAFFVLKYSRGERWAIDGIYDADEIADLFGRK